MQNFKLTSLPFKYFSDFSMSSDGKVMLAVTHLSCSASSQNYLKNFRVSDPNFYLVFSGSLNGVMDRKDFVKNCAENLSKYIYSGNWFADGSVYSSWNYGKTWHLQSGLKPRNWVSCDMSQDGGVQVMVGRGIYKDFFDTDVVEDTPTHAYISYDSGASWTPRCSSRTWNAVTVSPSGNYFLGSDTYLNKDTPDRPFQSNYRPIFKNNILFSDTSGLGWSACYTAPISNYYINTNSGIYSTVNFSEDVGRVGSMYNDFSYFGKKQAKLSSDGRYQLISSMNGVVTNSHYGDFEFTKINPSFIHSRVVLDSSGPIVTGHLNDVFLPLCCDMSSDGKYQIIGGQGFIGGSGTDSLSQYDETLKKYSWFSDVSYGNIFNPDLYFSLDYGETWSYFPTLESGMFCVSVSISENFQNIGLLAVPNTKLYKNSRRYGSEHTYSDIFNYQEKYNFNKTDLIYLYSSNSGVTWSKQPFYSSPSIYTSGIFSAQNAIINQSPLGLSPDKDIYSNPNQFNFEKNFSDRVYYNYPESEFLNTENNFLNILNSKIIKSYDGEKTALLHNGCILLSTNFPSNTPDTVPSKINQISFPSSFKNWEEIVDSRPHIVDIKISNNGQHISYIVNSGSLFEDHSIRAANSYYTIEYSGNLNSGQTHSFTQEEISKLNSYKKGLIYSSSDSGVNWVRFDTPEFFDEFDYRNEHYGKIVSSSSGYCRNNLLSLAMSSNGQYQVAFSDSLIRSGYQEINTQDPNLELFKYKYYTTYFYSDNYGQNWSVKYFQTTPLGLSPDNLYISNNGGTIYFVGNNTGSAYFNDIRTDPKAARQDNYSIRNYKLLPFADYYYKNTTSYNIPNVHLPGRCVHYTLNSGNSWSKLSYIEDMYFSGSDRFVKYTVNDKMLAAINKSLPDLEKFDTSLISGFEIFNSNINSFCPSDWDGVNGTQFSRNSIISIENAIPNKIIRENGLVVGDVKNPIANGYFSWDHANDTFVYKSILTPDKANRDVSLLNYEVSGSLNFKEICVAQNNPSLMVASCQAEDYFIARNSNLLGNILTDISIDELRSIFLTRDSGLSWLMVSPVAKINDLNISDDGRCISYLVNDASQPVISNTNEIYNRNNLLLDEGFRFGVPYISNDYGQFFHPILKWEPDIERRRSCFVGNEYLKNRFNKLQGNEQLERGASESPLLDYGYNIYGLEYSVDLGYTDLNYFYASGEKNISIIEAINEGILLLEKYDFTSYAFSRNPRYFTKAHFNTSLNSLGMSPNGKYHFLAQNDQSYNFNNLFIGNDSEKFYELNNSDYRSVINSKIYLNDFSGFFEREESVYVTGSGVFASDPLISTNKTIVLYKQFNETTGLQVDFTQASGKELHVYLGGAFQPFVYEKAALKQLYVLRDNQFIYLNNTGDYIQNASRFIETNNEVESSVLYTTSNLFTTNDSFGENVIYPTGVRVDATERFPSGIGFSSSITPTLTGFSYETGVFRVKVYQDYMLGDGYNHTEISYINLTITQSNKTTEYPSVVSVYTAFDQSGISAIDASISYANFYGSMINGFYSRNLNGISGFGPQLLSPPVGTTGFGIINDPTGLFNLVSYEDVVLSGFIPELNESYTWQDVPVIGAGALGRVYYDIITGYTQSYNYAYVKEDKLVDGDQIIINDIVFTYKTNQPEADQNIFWFNTLDELMIYAAPIALVTGFYDGSKLNMYSIIDGDIANEFTLRRDTSDLSAVIIPSLYFQGGSDLRLPAGSWSGDYFSSIIPEVNRINSGFYSRTGLVLGDTSLTGSGIVWDANISKTMEVKSGLFSSFLRPLNENLGDLNFDSTKNMFYGTAVMPSGQTLDFSGIKFKLKRSIFDSGATGLGSYFVSGKDIYYSGNMFI